MRDTNTIRHQKERPGRKNRMTRYPPQSVFRVELGVHSYLPPAKAVRQLPHHVTLDVPLDWTERLWAWSGIALWVVVGFAAITMIHSVVYGG
jgi:hypothetical protein